MEKINNKNIFRLLLSIITTIISFHDIQSKLSLAKTQDGIISSENHQINNKILVCEVVQHCSYPKEWQPTSPSITLVKINNNIKTNKSNTIVVLPNTISYISSIISHSSDSINSLQYKDNQVPTIINKTMRVIIMQQDNPFFL